MAATTIMIIRHGEKPGTGSTAAGVTPDGVADPHSLVVRGWQRAGAWAGLFGSARGGAEYPPPDVIYACDPGTASGDSDDDAASQRPFQTITPLADRLNLNPRRDFGVEQGAEMARDALTAGGTVLICWEHKRIVSDILPVLLGRQTPPGVPSRWHGSRFDVVLRLDRKTPEMPWSFRQSFPLLLSGDSDAPM